MNKKILEIPFKGARDYIQGPDLFNAALQAITEGAGENPCEFEIAFHRMARKQIELVWNTGELPQNAFAVGSWKIAGGERARYAMCEREMSLKDRLSYEEDKIVDRLVFSDDFSEACLKYRFKYTDMELWVSMIKAMHQRRFAETKGKWVFVRAKLCGYKPDCAPASLRVKLMATLGTKLTRNTVYLNDDKIGDVFFALM